MGRPRNAGAREPNGRKQRGPRHAFERDLGTAEALGRRIALVGGFPDPSEPRRPCDPADKRAGYPLGILFMRGDITEAEYEAGRDYLRLHYLLFGAGSTRSHLASIQVGSLDGEPPPEPISEEKRDKLVHALELTLQHSTDALHALPTRRPYSVLCNLVLYDKPLRFMDSARRRTDVASLADARDLEALKLGLDTLAALA